MTDLRTILQTFSVKLAELNADPKKYRLAAARLYRDTAAEVSRHSEGDAWLSGTLARLRELAEIQKTYTGTRFQSYFDEGRIVADDLLAREGADHA